MNKLLFAISMAKKSGKLVYGYESVKTAALDGSARLVIVTKDTSEKSIKRVKYFCEDIIDVYVAPLTQFEVSQVAGRLTGILAVSDENLAILCRNAIKSTEGEM